MLIGLFSTDWQQSQVPDPARSALTGRQEFRQDQASMSFGGTFYYRGAMPFMELAKRDDWDVRLSWRFQTKPDGTISMMDPTGEWFEPDVVWTQRWMHHEGHDQMMRARAAGQIVVSDLDDGFWHLPKSNIAHDTTSPKNNPDFNRDHYLRTLQASDLITVSTEALAKDMERMCPGVNVIICRNAIDLERWPAQDPGDEKMIGWVGGIQWRAADLGVLRPALSEFLIDHDLPVYHGGDSQVPGVAKFWEQAGIDTTRTKMFAAPLCHIAQYPGLWTPIGLALVPLENHPFNVRKCVEKSMRVITPTGREQIGSIAAGDVVWSNAGWSKVQAVESQGWQDGVEIHTKYGRVLRVSNNHRMWVNGKWITADEIRDGDTLSVVSGGRSRAVNNITANWPADSRISRNHETNYDFLGAPDSPRVEINERWGRFLGLFLSDGSVGQGTTVSISCDGQDADLIEMIERDISSFGLHSFTNQTKTWSGQVLRRRYVAASSAHLVRFLYGLGLVEWSGDNVKATKQRKVFAIPDVIWRSPSKIQAAFLAGLFEADDSVSRTSVSFTTKDNRLARDVQLMLGTFGIESFIGVVHNAAKRGGGKRRYFTVRTRRAGSDAFFREIGFLSHRKQVLLTDLAARPHSNAYKPMTWTDAVEAIKPVRIETMDIQVASEEFAVEGLRTHNSHLKGLEASACGIPFIYSKGMPEYERFGGGISADNRKPASWRAALESMLDPEARRIEGVRNREIAEQWDIAKRWTQWDEALRTVIPVHA